jgi:hypothetical protein
MGYAITRTIPLHWILLGIILTLLDSWNAAWAWVPLNILVGFAFVRAMRPYVQSLLQKYGWISAAFLIVGFVVVQSSAVEIIDYGAEGWLWALLGLCQRLYKDRVSENAQGKVTRNFALGPHAKPDSLGAIRVLVCVAAATFYVWQEQLEFSFSPVQFAVLILSIGILSVILSAYQRGASQIQPPQFIARIVRFISRYSLEIYAIQLAGSELITKMVPELAP